MKASLTNLEPGTQYKVQVAGIQKDGNRSQWSNTYVITTDPDSPHAAPTGGAVTHPNGGGHFRVSWTAPALKPDFNGYIVEVSEDNFVGGVDATYFVGDVTSWDFTLDMNDATYATPQHTLFFRVYSLDKGGTTSGTPLDIINGGSGYTYPIMATLAAPTGTSFPAGVNWEWTPPSTGADIVRFYNIDVDTPAPAEDPFTPQVSEIIGTAYSFAGSASTEYAARVRATDVFDRTLTSDSSSGVTTGAITAGDDTTAPNNASNFVIASKTTTGDGESEINLTWTASTTPSRPTGDRAGYAIRYNINGQSEVSTVIVENDATEHTLRALRPNTQYDIEIATFDYSANFSSYLAVAGTAGQKTTDSLPAPGPVTSVAVDWSTPDLKVTVTDGARGVYFKHYRLVLSDGVTSHTFTSEDKEFVITPTDWNAIYGSTPSVEHDDVDVYAVDTWNNASTVVNPSTATYSFSGPSDNGGLSLTLSEKTITASWTAADDAVKYDVIAVASASGATVPTNEVVATVTDGTTASFAADVGTNYNWQYNVRVISYDAFGNTDTSASQLSGTPSTMTAVTPSMNAGIDAMSATWTAVSGAAKYAVYVEEDTTPPTVLHSETVDLTTQWQTDGSTLDWYIQVFPVNAIGTRGVASQIASETATTVSGGDITPPGQVTGVSVSVGATDYYGIAELEVTWDANPAGDLFEYAIRWSEGNTSNWAPLARVDESIDQGFPGTPFYIRDLKHDTQYYVQVAAIDTSENFSPWSAAANQTTADIPAMEDPVGSLTYNWDTPNLVITHNDSEDYTSGIFKGYRLKVATTGGTFEKDFTGTKVIWTFDENFSFNDGTPDKHLLAGDVDVYAVDIYDRERGPMTGATVANDAPGPPTGLSFSRVPEVITLSWTAPANPEDQDIKGYKVYAHTSAPSKNSAYLIDFITGTTIDIVTASAPEDEWHFEIYATDVFDSDSNALSGSYDSVPVWDVSDGAVPSQVTGVSVSDGVGGIHVTWSAVTNNDPVAYKVHMGATNNFTVNDGNEVGRVDGLYFFAKTEDNAETPIPYDTDRYIRVRATDRDGDGTPSATPAPSAQSLKVDTPDIAADAVTANEIAAGEVNAGHLAANSVTAGKLAIGSIGFEPVNSSFEAVSGSMPIGWVVNTGSASHTTTGANVASGSGALALTGGSNSQVISDPFPFEIADPSGVAVYARAALRASTGTQNAKLQLLTYTTTDGTGTATTYDVHDATATTTYARYGGSLAISQDATVKSARWAVEKTTSGSVYVDNLEAGIAVDGVIITDGSIAAPHLDADSVYAQDIQIKKPTGKIRSDGYTSGDDFGWQVDANGNAEFAGVNVYDDFNLVHDDWFDEATYRDADGSTDGRIDFDSSGAAWRDAGGGSYVIDLTNGSGEYILIKDVADGVPDGPGFVDVDIATGVTPNGQVEINLLISDGTTTWTKWCGTDASDMPLRCSWSEYYNYTGTSTTSNIQSIDVEIKHTDVIAQTETIFGLQVSRASIYGTAILGAELLGGQIATHPDENVSRLMLTPEGLAEHQVIPGNLIGDDVLGATADESYPYGAESATPTWMYSDDSQAVNVTDVTLTKEDPHFPRGHTLTDNATYIDETPSDSASDYTFYLDWDFKTPPNSITPVNGDIRGKSVVLSAYYNLYIGDYYVRAEDFKLEETSGSLRTLTGVRQSATPGGLYQLLGGDAGYTHNVYDGAIETDVAEAFDYDGSTYQKGGDFNASHGKKWRRAFAKFIIPSNWDWENTRIHIPGISWAMPGGVGDPGSGIARNSWDVHATAIQISIAETLTPYTARHHGTSDTQVLIASQASAETSSIISNLDGLRFRQVGDYQSGAAATIGNSSQGLRIYGGYTEEPDTPTGTKEYHRDVLINTSNVDDERHSAPEEGHIWMGPTHFKEVLYRDNTDDVGEFVAWNNSTQIVNQPSSPDIVTFAYKKDPGGNFSTASNWYVAPHDGEYFFWFETTLHGTATGPFYWQFWFRRYVQSVPEYQTEASKNWQRYQDSDRLHVIMQAVCYMDAGDYMRVYVDNNANWGIGGGLSLVYTSGNWGGANDHEYGTSFGGYRIG